ncbi:hypothetical protein RJ640_007346 [Escallonia rubra]|uniref:glycine--tRNA ligase n=1 Tax=Escallonia rubra TaxID=112253 RepID=A0AA88QSW8_9ASTE|nr:hypothetical protein RJ640_007346 [Escallonia rubra]
MRQHLRQRKRELYGALSCIEVDDFVETSSELLQPLEDFFNHVFVMVEDEKIRSNRLALLKKISDLPRGIADLSVLPGF